MLDILLGSSNTFSSYHNNLIQYVVLLLQDPKAELSARSRQFGIEIQAVVMNQVNLKVLPKLKVSFAAGHTLNQELSHF